MIHSSKITAQRDTPVERLQGAVERVTFHSEESGFCVLRVKVRVFPRLTLINY
jgi:hypothetical protein